MARDSAYEMRDRALDHPALLQLLGAGVGALAARMAVAAIVDRARERRFDRGGRLELEEEELESSAYGRGMAPDVGETAGEGAGTAAAMKDRLSAAADQGRERVREGIGRVQERIGRVRESLPDTGELRARASDQLALWAVGAMGIGAMLAMVVPVTEGERRAIGPAKEKVRELEEQGIEKVKEAGERTVEKAMDTAVKAATRLTGSEEEEEGGEHAGEPHEPQPPAIH